MTDDPRPSDISDDFVRDFVETKWREAVRLTAEATETLREVWPEFSQALSETGSSALSRALNDFESAHHNLHRAGRHVLGQEAYERFLEAMAQKKIG